MPKCLTSETAGTYSEMNELEYIPSFTFLKNLCVSLKWGPVPKSQDSHQRSGLSHTLWGSTYGRALTLALQYHQYWFSLITLSLAQREPIVECMAGKVARKSSSLDRNALWETGAGDWPGGSHNSKKEVGLLKAPQTLELTMQRFNMQANPMHVYSEVSNWLHDA